MEINRNIFKKANCPILSILLAKLQKESKKNKYGILKTAPVKSPGAES